MKKISLLFTLAVLSLVMLTGCLKDKGFEDQRYGIQGKDTRGVSFPESVASPKGFALDAVTTLQTTTVGVALESSEAASSDVKVGIAVNNALVTTAGLTPVPANAFTVPATITIPAGQREVAITVGVPNASVLDPNVTYGIGLSISSVDGGYQIAQNMKNIVLSISIKNKYDGVYEITGKMTDANGLYVGDYGDPAAPRIYEMATTGAGSVLFYDRSWDYPNYIVVSIATGGGANTGIRPEFTFDPATDNLVSAINKANGAVLTVGPGSKFNPADRSATINWTLGRWKVEEQWKYIGPR